MNKYIYLSDLDGTILDDTKIITPRTRKALEDFVSRGNVFAICTGRDIVSGRSVYDGLGLKLRGSYVVAYNGGVIYDVDAGKVIYKTGIDREIVRDILKMAEESDIHVHTYNDEFILSQHYNECMEFYRRVIKTPLIVCDDIMPYVTVAPSKMICIELHDHEKQENFRKAVLKKYGDVLSLMYSNDYYLELIPKESGKGSALIRLADHLGIDRAHTIASGDAENDMSMIEAAGIGIAMINAPANVKAVADIVTETDNNHDGLAPILEKY